MMDDWTPALPLDELPDRRPKMASVEGTQVLLVRNGQDVWNAEHSVLEKLNHLTVQQGKERIELPELREGDIGSVAKLKNTHTNDTFSLPAQPVQLPPVPFPEAMASSAVMVKQRGEEDKLAAGLHKIHEEDPTFHFEYSSELGQTLIHGLGEKHFEIILGRLQRKYGVHAELVRRSVKELVTVSHGNAWSAYFKDPEGNRIEVFVDSPWYTPQPCRQPLDLTQPVEQITGGRVDA